MPDSFEIIIKGLYLAMGFHTVGFFTGHILRAVMEIANPRI
jgi:hypothetical protein